MAGYARVTKTETNLNIEFELKKALQRQQQLDLYRHRRCMDTPQQAVIRLDGKKYLNFSGNDYLGLANHEKLRDALKLAVDEAGVGSGAAHLVCGHHQYHHELEQALAQWTGRGAALLFSTGYMANLAVISALLGRHDTIVEDRLNHASLLDGAALSRAKLRRYRHTDADDLEKHLEKSTGRILVASDGVFSMDGDLCPVAELSRLAQAHDAWVMVDDAHGLGVLGDRGGGLLESENISEQQVPVLMGTLGKALGCFGAFVAGSSVLVEYLINFARPYIFTTALPPALARAVLTAISLAQSETWRRRHLQALIEQFQHGARERELNILPSHTPIQPLILGESQTVLAWSGQLRRLGFFVGAMRPPTVAAGSARLRITLSAAHDPGDVDRLLDALDRLNREAQGKHNP